VDVLTKNAADDARTPPSRPVGNESWILSFHRTEIFVGDNKNANIIIIIIIIITPHPPTQKTSIESTIRYPATNSTHPTIIIMFGDLNSNGLSNNLQHQVHQNLHQVRSSFGVVPPLLRGGAHDPEQNKVLFEDIFESHPSVDYSDNPAQVRVIKHHYLNEFGKHLSLHEVLKDYSEDTVIHEVLDNVPRTYHGHEGVRQAFRDMFKKIPHDTSHFEFDHIAIDHNHAQVVWKAETPSRGVIIGTDSFAFGKDNRIIHQTIVAMTCDASEPEK
jgi:hypothetical protein